MANSIRSVTAVMILNVANPTASTGTCTDGSLLVACVIRDSRTASVSVSDPTNGTYTQDVYVNGTGSQPQSGGGSVGIYSDTNSGTSAKTVTAALGTADYGHIKLYEITGQASGTVVDVTDTDAVLSATALSLSLTTGTANCSIIVAGCNYGSGSSAVDSGYTSGMTEVLVDWSYNHSEYNADVGAAGAKTLTRNSYSSSSAHTYAAVAYKTNAGGGGVTTTPGAGSITYAGLAPTFSATANKFTSPGAGAIVYAGLTPACAVTANKFTSPGAGAVVYSGLGPSFSITLNVFRAPGAGAVTYAGLAPTFSYTQNWFTSPGAGAITYSGLAPAPVITGSAVTTPEAGSIVYAGAAPTPLVTANIWVLPGAGSVAYQGQVPSFGSGLTVTPGAGAIVYEGAAPAFNYTQNWFTSPGAGEITYIGLRPTIDVTGQQVEPVVEGRGNWDRLNRKPRQRPIRIKYSDYESQEAYARALAAAAQPITRVVETAPQIAPPMTEIVEAEDDDDLILKTVIMRLLHA